ncbi:syntaxin-binding protein 1-like [Stegodyphus dumicola]|uniref:syntaxin-binding protein 1-like n=1 Tax=Stegodyphus dumicola TaxID=202533 RepID=UPI0015ADE380|nr:syntaxin-binding protein 1-like [Stegodyphus dumicola]
MPWHRKESNLVGIRNICRRRLLENIFDPLKVRNEWKVLIVDKLAMSILATCFKTQEIMACNIAIIEEMEQERQSIPYLSAIYILTSSEEVICKLYLFYILLINCW